MRLAEEYDLESLQTLSRCAYVQIDLGYDRETTDWSKETPTWSTRNQKRGLLGWGETRKEQSHGVVALKKGSINNLCRCPILKAFVFYFATIGLPPVIAGESKKKALASGRIKLVLGEAAPKSNKVLVPLQPPEGPVDLLEPFLMVVCAAYCIYLDPPVEDGTLSSYAVLGFLRTQCHVKVVGRSQVALPSHRK